MRYDSEVSMHYRHKNELVRHLPRPDGAGHSQSTILVDLREAILRGAVQPGSPIPVDAIADHFGVSRIPVREALKTLIGEGLVDHRPNHGYRIAQLTMGELEELHLVRGVLESAAHDVAVERATASDDARARATFEALDASVHRNDSTAYQRESRNFHVALAAPCAMPRLLHMFESAWNITEPVQTMTRVATPERLQLHRDHRAMLDAFLARDATALRTVTAAHNTQLDAVIAALPTHTGIFRDEPQAP